MNNLKVKRLEVGEMKSNCYLLSDLKEEVVLIIDPGEDTEYIQNNLIDTGFVPTAILLTHGHFDHILRAEELRVSYDIPVYLNKKDNFLVENMLSSANRFTYAGPALKLSNYRELKGEYKFFNNNVEVIHTPGHTPGSVSLYFKEANYLFVGDLMFEGGGVGRYDFSYSDRERLFNSIDTIMELPEETRVFPGHGKPTTIEALKYYF